ncbi:MAG: hypothetical protein NTX49_01600 [Chlamydiae bacterium]|nr:hypothetical protein [Chlamydiota bacterium]
MSFITENYSVKLFNVRSVEEATVLLLGEAHDRPDCRALNGRLMSMASDKTASIALFTEATPSMEIPDDIPFLKEHLFLRFDPELIYGWDAKQSDACVAATKYVVKCTLASMEIEGARDSLIQQLEALPGLTTPEEINAFFALPQAEVDSRVNQAKSLKEGLIGLNDMYLHALSESSEARKRMHIELQPDSRTHAMVETLKKVRGLRSELAIFVAGAAHLKGTHFDLSSLYSELATHKAAILVPNCISSLP